MPSVTQLDEWVLEQVDRRRPGWSPAARLFNSLHTLLQILCDTTSEAHIVRPNHVLLTRLFSLIWCQNGFPKAALRITNLYECSRTLLSADKSQVQGTLSYISRAAGIQIALVAKRGVADCELQILSELDSLVQKSKKLSKDSQLHIWAGVWILILLYRDLLRRYQHMSQRKHATVRSEYIFTPSEHWANTWQDYETSIFLARRMYNALTSTYNLLFCKKSLSKPHLTGGENVGLIGQNTRIRDLLILIKEQTHALCKVFRLRKSTRH